MRITEKVTDFVRLNPDQKHHFFQEVWQFDQIIFPYASIEYLYDYMHDVDAVSVQVIRYYHADQLVGQNIIPILKLPMDAGHIFVLYSRAGFLPSYRRRNLTLYSAIRVALKQRLQHPGTALWFVPTIMQPKVYMLFASRSQHFYPRANQLIPDEHLQVLQLVKTHHRDVDQRDRGVYVHPCDLPKMSAEHLIRLRNPSETHVNYFMTQVPDYFEGYGMMCVCKLDVKTIFETLMNLTLDRIVH